MSKQETAGGVERAAERVALACRALSAAATELRSAHARKVTTVAVEDAVSRLAQETERVCELAEDLVSLATGLRWSAAAPSD